MFLRADTVRMQTETKGKLMKRMLIALAVCCASSSAALADNYVNGYYRSNGTYVEPHYRSDPNNNRFDNYSSQGNVNPYTGKSGTVDPYRVDPPSSGYGNYGVNNLNRRNY